MSLKQKTVSGLTWSFIDNFANYFIHFVFGIIMARLLSPREFGLVGMITIFIAVSQSFINSGFSQALIRKKDCTQTDFSTVFFFNMGVSVFFYLLLFFFSGAISRFYDEPLLRPMIQIVGIGLLINAFTIVQRSILTKNINFKLQTKISVITSIFSGIVGITLAYNDYGVWSLVVKTLTGFAITSALLWVWNKWKPSIVFSIKSLKEMFSFGSKLLISGLIDTIYRNIYLLIIGKYFSATELGYYTRADHFSQLPSQNITSVVQRVSYPVLSTIQDDIPRLKASYQKMIKSTMLLTFVLMLGMAAIAKPMVLTLIGDKWLPSVIYLQLLCFVGMFYPLHAMNLNMLQVQGRSDLFLRLEIIKKILAIPTIIIGVFFGIKILIIAMFINTIISYYINSYWSGKMIGYSFLNQVKDIFPSFLLAAIIALIVFYEGNLLQASNLGKLIIQIVTGAILTIGISEIFRLKDYLYIKEIIYENVFKKKEKA